jgi:hypothetical protein
VSPETATVVLKEWERQRGDEFRAHFEQAYSYLGSTVRELASDAAPWTIAHHEDHPVLLLASDTAFALIAFSGPPESVTIKGALHPLLEDMVRVSFSDQRPTEDVEVGMARIRPIVRQWRIDWHGRLQQPVEYWLPQSWGDATTDPGVEVIRRHHERQRAMAHQLAWAAGWPMPVEPVPDAGSSAA